MRPEVVAILASISAKRLSADVAETDGEGGEARGWEAAGTGTTVGAATTACAEAVWLFCGICAVTVAVAIFAIVVWANGLGSVLPILVQKIGLDPTVVSGPAMSTLVDATGLFIYFTVAGVILAL